MPLLTIYELPLCTIYKYTLPLPHFNLSFTFGSAVSIFGMVFSFRSGYLSDSDTSLTSTFFSLYPFFFYCSTCKGQCGERP